MPRKLLLINGVIDRANIDTYYGNDTEAISIPKDMNATTRAELVTSLKETMPSCNAILVADTNLFKTLASVTKVAGLDGYPMPSTLGTVFIVPSFRTIFFNPSVKDRLAFIISKVDSYIKGEDSSFTEVIKNSTYCYTIEEVKKFLADMGTKDALTIDIETCPDVPEGSGLHHYGNYLISIGMAYNEHSGGAIYLSRELSQEIRKLLKEFFINYKGMCIYHNSGFDVTNLIYHLFMDNLVDYSNLLTGLHTLCKNYEDTKLIAYLCLNSCGRTPLDLKSLSHEFTGKYAQDDIEDCSKIPITELLHYNLKDCCATWYVYNKYKNMLISEKQEDIYYNLFLPTQKVLIQTQLIGLRIDRNKLKELSNKLSNIYEDTYTKIINNTRVQEATVYIQNRLIEVYNNTHKRKIVDIEELRKLATLRDKCDFNPGSSDHLIVLLYKVLKLPILDTTKGGDPSTKSDVIEKLINNCTIKEDRDLLQLLIDLSKVSIIRNTFISNFEKSPIVNGQHSLYGSFNLGSTVTGRLSSSQPNLQNLPSTGSVYAKPVKKIFTYPDGFIFVGADMRSLEDRISALTTRDINKGLVYTDGYDGHCLRAYGYFSDKMPDIKKVPDDEVCYKVTNDDGKEEYLTKEDFIKKYPLFSKEVGL